MISILRLQGVRAAIFLCAGSLVGCSASGMSAQRGATANLPQQKQASALASGTLVKVSLPKSIDPSQHVFALQHGTEVFKFARGTGTVPHGVITTHYQLIFVRPGKPRPSQVANKTPDWVVP